MSVTSKRSLLLSLKPNYAVRIFDGSKKVELRKNISPNLENLDAFIYATSPVRQLQGSIRIGKVYKGSPGEVWKKFSECAGISRSEFDIYYEGHIAAIALTIVDAMPSNEPVSLTELRQRFPNFVVPRSWRYLKPDEFRSFSELVPRPTIML